MNSGKDEIEKIVDKAILDFTKKLKTKFIKEKNKDEGVINQKKNNWFIAELGEEFL